MFSFDKLLNLGRKDDKIGQRTGNDGNDPFEGFICPSCHSVFSSAEELRRHFETAHDSPTNISHHQLLTCPKCLLSLDNEAELLSHAFQQHETDEIHKEKEKVAQLISLKEKLEAEIEQSSQKYSQIETSRDELYQKYNQQASLLKKYEEDLAESKQMSKSAENQLLMTKQIVASLETEINQRPSTDDVEVLKREIVKIQKMNDEASLTKEKELKSVQKKYGEMLCEKNHWKARASELEIKVEKLGNDKDSLLGIQVDLENQVTTLENLILDLQLTNKHTQELLIEKEAKYTEKVDLISKLSEDLKATKEELQQEKAARIKLISKIEEGEGTNVAIAQLKEEREMYVNELQNRVAAQTNEISSMKADIEHFKQQLLEMKHKLELANSINNYYETHNTTAYQCTNSIKQQFSIVKSLTKKMIKKQKAAEENHNKKLEIIEKQYNVLKRILLDSIKFIHGIRRMLHLMIEDANPFPVLPPDISELTDLAFGTVHALSAVKQQLNRKNDALDNCRQRLSDCEKELQNQTEEFAKQLSEYRDVAEREASAMKRELQELKASKELSLEKLQQYEKIEHEDKEEIQNLQSAVASLTEANVELHKDFTQLSCTVEDLQKDKSTLTMELKSCKDELDQQASLIESLQSSFNTMTAGCEKMKNEKEKLIKDLEAAKLLLVNSNVKYEKEIEALKGKLLKETEELSQTISNLTNENNKLGATNAELSSELESLQLTYQQKEKDWENSTSHYAAQISVYAENTNTLKDDLLAERKQKEQYEKSLDEVTGIKLELEAKLENALEERKALLDRCLKSESENEKLLQNSADIRRRHDDAVAALQELGRENQALQVENLRHLGRKWADDSEVTHCTSCGKTFTVTIRKHHCRNCGSIFCNECSSKTATVPSSKRPARVCDQCFKELSK